MSAEQAARAAAESAILAELEKTEALEKQTAIHDAAIASANAGKMAAEAKAQEEKAADSIKVSGGTSAGAPRRHFSHTFARPLALL